MQINVVLDKKAKMPTKAHDTDAGFDIYAPYGFRVSPGKGLFVDTGVHVQIPAGYVGMIKSKSGLNKLGLQCEGVIDCGYTGSIGLKLYNHGADTIDIAPNQKVTQLVILPIPQVELVQVDSLETTDRGNGGFGSTGAF